MEQSSYKPMLSDTLEVIRSILSYNPNNIRYCEDKMLNLGIKNLEELSDIPLYKYFSLNNLSYMLNGKKLFVDNISKSWEDCYENFFLKSYFNLHNQPLGTDNLIPSFFGQSWTTKTESDAMWRIYSSDKNGIRIKTNAKKLFDAIYINDKAMANTWFGKVKYDIMQNFYQELNNEIQQQEAYQVFQFTLPKTQFMKRKEFDHEDEFRLIVMMDSEETVKYNQYKRIAYNIDIDDFIEEYCLDPRLLDGEFETQKQKLITLGADSNKIIKSNLYYFKPFVFDL